MKTKHNHSPLKKLMKTKIIELIHLWQIPLLILFALTACKKDNLWGGHTISNCTVVDKTTQQPIANAQVRLIYDDSDEYSGVSGKIKDTKYTDANGFVCFDFKDTEDQYNFLIDVKYDKYFFMDAMQAKGLDGTVYTGRRNYNRIELQPEAYLKIVFQKERGSTNTMIHYSETCNSHHITTVESVTYIPECPQYGNTQERIKIAFMNLSYETYATFIDTILPSFDTTTIHVNF